MIAFRTMDFSSSLGFSFECASKKGFKSQYSREVTPISHHILGRDLCAGIRD